MDRRVRAVLAAGIVAAVAALVPRVWCGAGAAALYDGDVEAQEALAREVAAYVGAGVSTGSFSTGSARFDGEWTVVTHQMAALGLGQIVLAHPERRAEHLPVIEASIERLLAPEATAFGAEAWHERGLEALGSEHGHAYLGYVNLAIGMLRRLDPGTRFAPLHDRLTESLARRLEAAPFGMIETYPGEAYPADVAAVVGSIGLHDRATGADHGALLARWARIARERYVDPRSGLAFQNVDARLGEPRGPGRASGTAIAVYFLSFADPSLSRELFRPLATSQRASFLGFGGIREYPSGAGGWGDVDSGPVLLGVGVSATGFAIAGARIHGDRALYTELFRTAELFGVRVRRTTGTRFMSGGPLGNALLLAMLTATPEAR